MAAVLTNRTYEEIFKLKGLPLEQILTAISFLDKEPRKTKSKPFKINGTEYMFHPELSQLTAGEQVSIEQYMIEGEISNRSMYPELLSILIRPTVKKENAEFGKNKITIEEFDTEFLKERKELFLENLTVDKFIHEINFILTIGKKHGKRSQ